MKFLILSLFLFLWISCGRSSPPKEMGLLWEISGNGLKKSSYLLGTDHLIPASFLDSIAGFHAAFNNIDQFVCESTSGDIHSFATLSEIKMPTDTTYIDLLNKEDLIILDSVLFKYFSVKSDRFYIKPAILNILLLSIKSIEKHPEYTTNLNSQIDNYLEKSAAGGGKNIVTLDDDSLILKICSQSLEEQAKALMCMIKYPIIWEAQEKMNELYRKQDLDGIKHVYEHQLLMLDSIGGACAISQEEDWVLKGRNMKWMEKLPALIERKPTFIAVGVLHLVGETGLINHLRKLGYTVEPIK